MWSSTRAWPARRRASPSSAFARRIAGNSSWRSSRPSIRRSRLAGLGGRRTCGRRPGRDGAARHRRRRPRRRDVRPGLLHRHLAGPRVHGGHPLPGRGRRGRRSTVTVSGAPALDAIVVGAGPNGLAAALTLARAGRSVRVYEAASTIGGGTRTEELTLPGFRHDVCSTIVPLALASPFFRTIDWAAHGVELVHPDAPVAHALDDGRAVVLERSFTATAAGLDRDRRTDDGSALAAALRTAGPRRRQARARAAPSGASTSRAIHSRLPGSACRRCARPAGWREAASAASRRGRCSPGSRPTAMVAARPTAVGVVRPGARDVCARGRLADGPRRLGGHRRRPGGRAPAARRRDRHRPSTIDTPRRPPGGARGPARHDTARGGRRSPATDCRRAHPPPVRGLPLRGGRLQGRLGARRPRSRGPPTACVARRTIHLGRHARRGRSARSGRSPPAGHPTDRSRCSPSTTRGIHRERRPARRRPGRTATSLADPTST